MTFWTNYQIFIPVPYEEGAGILYSVPSVVGQAVRPSVTAAIV